MSHGPTDPKLQAKEGDDQNSTYVKGKGYILVSHPQKITPRERRPDKPQPN